ncbi:MAG: methyltransferase domain-containing protein [Chlorogloeopsis fritschii C42_A2020_084]|uniref:class I SAM-dependent methyltransferase n=1 Tax=Chlorogloeopsis fritschii TaxID=1124 RepID=UPI0019EED06D|nr:class I SAM-dependent methyltransferase [Chlorogloeopsis fritschii]MBF2008994.1 methyltransferase domain-containing protein [Chlorogloeopsis fritschii C42_A2020_084]
MKLTVKPENILEAIALNSRKELQPFLLGMLGMGVSQVLVTAIRMNVFDALQEHPKTAAELTTQMDCDPHGMQVLLESLDGFGFLKRQGQHYQLTQDSARYLTKSGGLIYDFLRLGGDINQQLVLLEKDIRTGEVPNFHFNPQSATCFANYYTMLKSSGQQSAPNILKWAKLNPPPKRLLDVAGGPAEYSIAFCQKYPDLKADILDLPNAIQAGLPQIEQAGLGDRIQYIEGNLLETNWGNNYDVVFLSNIFHCLTAEQCEITLKKAFQALRSGGTVLINDLFHPGEQGKLSSPISLFSLIYYVTCGGRIWPQPTILDWLTKAGFDRIYTGRNRLALFVSAQKP